uniref:Sorting nexin 13 n=1 Tax=Neolamprologus brichardi TaxID=32507 RepID=A0A3Q4GUU8_NEOBR
FMLTRSSHLSIWGWGGLGVVLFLVTFGPFAIFYLAFYIFCFIGGGFAVTLLYGKINSEKHLEKCEHSYLPPTQIGILKTLDEMKLEMKPIKIDRRLTGSSFIDEPLQQVCVCVPLFVIGLVIPCTFLVRKVLVCVLLQNWCPFFFVNDFCEVQIRDKKCICMPLTSVFFIHHKKATCQLLPCWLPGRHGIPLNVLCSNMFVEVLARGVLLPLINQLSDPDYINQFVIWMIRDNSCNYEAFMNILKLTDKPAELEAVRDKVLEELQFLRSLDTAGDDINVIKNQINSLLFVKKVCETRIQRLQSGKEVDAFKLAANFGKLCVIPLDHILVHNIALQFFMDFMQAAGAQAELFFWLTVEGYRVTAQQQLEAMQSWQKDGKKQPSDTKGLLKAAALGVYEQYLSDKASPRVQVDEASLTRLGEKLRKDDPTPEIFDEIQRKVYDMMLRDERYYPSFKQSPLYVRMLAELDMLKEPSYRGSDDGDGESFNGSPTGSINLVTDACLPGFWGAAGVCNDHGKTYALYTITVVRRNQDGSEDAWKTYRRYSDFHDFHMRITEQFENLASILKLPGKKTFNNMDRDFLEKRKKDLNAYLQLLLNPEMVKACPTLIPYVYDFLENKAYSKGKGEFARKIDTFVNPLRSSMRNVSNAVKAFPDSLAEGVNKVSDNMGRMSEKLGQDIKQSILKVPPILPKSEIDPEHCRVSAQLDDNVDDNIPLRVMLLLMDEVFDLKEKNQWLRRNIKNLLQQLIRATYGDTINRKIVDHVDYLTSPEQVADYVKRFRDSYWPNGILAETPPRRDKNIRMRTRVAAKTSLLGIMPDELKHIIGADTTRKGILRVFDMFQYQPMNRRLVYVFLEGFLETMFPQYKFPELFVKLHSRSTEAAGQGPIRYTDLRAEGVSGSGGD